MGFRPSAASGELVLLWIGGKSVWGMVVGWSRCLFLGPVYFGDLADPLQKSACTAAAAAVVAVVVIVIPSGHIITSFLYSLSTTQVACPSCRWLGPSFRWLGPSLRWPSLLL